MQVLWILLVPFIWFFIAKYWLRHTFTWPELGLSMLIITVGVSVMWFTGKYGKTHDVEVWNGQIMSKARHHDTWIESYSCNCSTRCSGGKTSSCTTTCQTCHRTHYTVNWSAVSTVGSINFQHLDSLSSGVYATPDPAVYTGCKVGEPASMEHSYVNYVKAVPESLFNNKSETVAQQYIGRIPTYPPVHSFYRFNRVINVGASVPSSVVTDLNNFISNELRALGPAKQVNIIVVLTSIKDPSYRYAIENAWLGGKKNDVVVFVGLDQMNIVWADVMTWALNTGNEMFHVKLRDDILELKTLDPTTFVPVLVTDVTKLYDRPHMKDFQYLEDQIEPPTWVIVLVWLFAIGGSIGLTVYFHKNDLGGSNNAQYRTRNTKW